MSVRSSFSAINATRRRYMGLLRICTAAQAPTGYSAIETATRKMRHSIPTKLWSTFGCRDKIASFNVVALFAPQQPSRQRKQLERRHHITPLTTTKQNKNMCPSLKAYTRTKKAHTQQKNSTRIGATTNMIYFWFDSDTSPIRAIRYSSTGTRLFIHRRTQTTNR